MIEQRPGGRREVAFIADAQRQMADSPFFVQADDRDLGRPPAASGGGLGDDGDPGACPRHSTDAVEPVKSNAHLQPRSYRRGLALDMILKSPARQADEVIFEKVGEPHLAVCRQRMLPTSRRQGDRLRTDAASTHPSRPRSTGYRSPRTRPRCFWRSPRCRVPSIRCRAADGPPSRGRGGRAGIR